jgi:Ni,Fe-hydrogenase III large subunit
LKTSVFTGLGSNTWDGLGIMLNKAKISDIASIVNSIDPCISCTEH